MIGHYQRYLQLLRTVAQQQKVPLPLIWTLCLMAVATVLVLLWQQIDTSWLLLPLLLALWLLLYLLICTGFYAAPPPGRGQPLRDKLRFFWFWLKLHCLALLTLLLFVVSGYASVKLLSVLIRALI